jgi:hypothetical protein
MDGVGAIDQSLYIVQGSRSAGLGCPATPYPHRQYFGLGECLHALGRKKASPCALWTAALYSDN